MPDYVVRRVVGAAQRAKHARSTGSRILLLGLAYKAGTSDWRESPAMTIVERLQALGADVRAHDAHVPADIPLAPGVERVDCSAEELEAADLVVLLVDHPDLPYDDIAAMRGSSSTRGPACEVTGSAARCCSRREVAESDREHLAQLGGRDHLELGVGALRGVLVGPPAPESRVVPEPTRSCRPSYATSTTRSMRTGSHDRSLVGVPAARRRRACAARLRCAIGLGPLLPRVVVERVLAQRLESASSSARSVAAMPLATPTWCSTPSSS